MCIVWGASVVDSGDSILLCPETVICGAAISSADIWSCRLPALGLLDGSGS